MLRDFISCVFNEQAVKPIFERTKESDEYKGWVFPDSETEVPGAEPDRLNGAKSIRELYEIASANYTGKYTVPVCRYTGFFCDLLCWVDAYFIAN